MIENREYTATAAVENRSEDFTSGHKTKKMTIAFTTLLVAIVAVFVDRFVIMRIQRQFSYTEGNSEAGVRFDVVDEEVLSLFVTFDENLDGVLDLSEFIQIANRILRRKVSSHVVIYFFFETRRNSFVDTRRTISILCGNTRGDWKENHA